jgi:hypothetical protein
MFWFNLKKKVAMLEIEYAKKKAELEAKLIIEAAKLQKDFADLLATGNKQMNDFEHEYHSGKEKRGIELARLDGEIEAKKEVLKAKDAELARALDIISKLATALSNGKAVVTNNNTN